MAKKKEEKAVVTNKKQPTIHDFDVIIAPLITEKTMDQNQNGTYSFKVKKDANKLEIKNAISKIFNVTVISVKTQNYDAKKLSRGSRYKGTKPSFKKAVVTLKEGEVINLFAE